MVKMSGAWEDETMSSEVKQTNDKKGRDTIKHCKAKSTEYNVQAELSVRLIMEVS
jgi:hypothetical protein